MIGWEFPPAKTGGLGTHCYELVKNLGRKGVKVTLLIPKRTENAKHNIPNVDVIEVGSVALNPYNASKPDNTTFEKGYGWNFFEEVKAFNKKCVEVAKNKKIVGADIVELSPIPGLVAPDFLAAKLVYKIISFVTA